jgi:hypothetical protein
MHKTPDITFCEFVHADENTRPKPHGIIIDPQREKDINLSNTAKELILLSKETHKN